MARDSSYKIKRGNIVVAADLPPSPPPPIPPSNVVVLPAPTKVLTTQEIRSRIQYVMSHYRYEPLQELVQLAMSASTPVDTRIQIHKELLKYVAPQLKSMDVQVQGEMEITVKVINFTDTNGKLAPRTELLDVTPGRQANG